MQHHRVHPIWPWQLVQSQFPELNLYFLYANIHVVQNAMLLGGYLSMQNLVVKLSSEDFSKVVAK